ncbi:MAG TPA: hypothetical protein VGI96_22275 [Streptosporangiaceae bacterium]|jgi:hypothetical protein
MTDQDLSQADVDEIRAFLTRTCEDAGRWLPGTGWRPAWQSEAEGEVRNSELRADGSPWGGDPVRTAYAAATVFLFAALDALLALRDSVSVSSTSYVPGVLSRAAMEAGSQAFWLLEPGIGARRRVIRSVLVRAGSAANLKETVEAVDPAETVSAYGEDPATIEAYAQGLALVYAAKKDQNGRKALECEGERLPTYTARAVALETGMKMSAGYRIYSGSAHAELYSVMQSWRKTTSGMAAPLERWCDREAVWAAALASAGFVMMPAFRALTLLDLRARLWEMVRSMQAIGTMTRQMKLPSAWRY